MKQCRLPVGALMSYALAASAGAQVHQVAFEWDISQPAEKAALDICVGASPDRVIVASNQVLALFERDGDEIVSIDVRIPDTTPPIDPKGVTNPNFIFDPSTKYIDPRIEYDLYSGRFWLLYLSGGLVHLAISEGPAPDGFEAAGTVPAGEGWHIYTGSDAFNLAHTSISGTPYEGGADHAAISFDEDRMWLTSLDAGIFTGIRQGVVSFPKTHDSGAKSILNGERPAYSDLKAASPAKLPTPNEDFSTFNYSVQEPFEDVAAGQFFISPSKGSVYGAPTASDPRFWNDVHSQLRLGGSWIDGSGALQYQWAELDVPAASDNFFNPSQPVGGVPALPATPESTWKIGTLSSKFDSGVLTRDVNGNLKIFAGHHVVAASQNGEDPVDRHEFRYYVIDPDLADFPGPNWAPEIEVVGSAPIGSVTNGETYEGAIAVNENGVAYITFTRSGTSNDGWPSLVRAQLSANYTTINFEQSGEAGPEQEYDDGTTDPRELGTDYCDMQPDYDHCGFWGVGAIAAFADGEPEPPTTTSARAIWLTEIFACNGLAEMNGDGAVDELDLALYMEYHAKGDQRADMDRSGTITAADYEIYAGKYAKR